MLPFRIALCATAFLAVLAGCSKTSPHAPARVSGRVTYNGKAVPGGNITFHSEGKGSFAGALDDNGTFEITDLPTGPMVVTVETESLNPKTAAPSYGGDKMSKMREMMQKKMGVNAAAAAAKVYRKIPRKYADRKTSPLNNVNVESGRNSYEFELKD